MSAYRRPRPVVNTAPTTGGTRTFKVTNDLAGRRVYEEPHDDDLADYGTARSNMSAASVRSEPIAMTLTSESSIPLVDLHHIKPNKMRLS